MGNPVSVRVKRYGFFHHFATCYYGLFGLFGFAHKLILFRNSE